MNSETKFKLSCYTFELVDKITKAIEKNENTTTHAWIPFVKIAC